MARPRIELTEIQKLQLEALSAVLTHEQIADYFGMCRKTFSEIMKRDEEVSTHYKKGKAKAIATVATNLISQAKSGNTTASIFYLKTQAGWKEEQNEAKDLPPINITLTNEAD